MIPIYLYISNFQAHAESEIDFSAFSSALVVGKVGTNDLIANGVGKTSIFRAIEYVLFNQVRDPLLQKDMILEKLIRDDTNKVSVTFDFAIGEEVFRIVRSRTRKDVSDLSFYRRNAVEGNAHTSTTNRDFWDDIASRRTKDTEDDLAKKIKSNYKSFINTNHFMQNDFSGIAVATPEKRKVILKETLGLMVYGKLEELAKEKAASIIKEVEKSRAEVSFLGNPKKDIEAIKTELVQMDAQQNKKAAEVSIQSYLNTTINKEHTALVSQLNVLETQAASVIAKRNALLSDINSLQTSINDYSYKTKSLAKTAKILKDDMDELKKELATLQSEDLDLEHNAQLLADKESELLPLSQQINDITAEQRRITSELEELGASLLALPKDDVCKHCRQVLTEEHRIACQKETLSKRDRKTSELGKLLIDAGNLTMQHQIVSEQFKLLRAEKQVIELRQFNLKFKSNELSAKDKEIQDKRKAYEEYQALIDQFNQKLIQKTTDLTAAEVEVQNSSAKEIAELKLKVDKSQGQLNKAIAELNAFNQELSNLQAQKAVLEHSLQQKTDDIYRKEKLEKSIAEAETEYTVYPSIIQAFSSSGVPNLIIQNMLEDLQTEANNLLTQIRPGLQLVFSTEKERSDGVMTDTLDINYFLNNKPRDYSQLSGAQRLCITFSLKLGLSFLLAKRFGAQIKFLLLDEIDQSLDKASTDALADIIKHFQKDFKILVITHSDRLQSKIFSHAIVVEQDQNMVSTARVTNSW